ncbi:MAG: hypothetical protein JXB32_23565 [Deltaproteobacteria bacterium]|nr:hypothetical protein [Deltaproteobacteria bacterium]
MVRPFPPVFVGLALALGLPGCSHDWSAADGSDAPDAPDTTDAADADAPFPDDGADADVADVVDDAGATDADADTDVDAAEATDDAADDRPTCDPTLEYCADGWLHRCSADGAGWEDVYCDFGCAPDELRCLRLAPANVTDDSLLDTGATALEVPALGMVVFHTASGEITSYDGSGAEVTLRPGGTGTLAGIPFLQQDQEDDSPRLGIWVFSRLTVGTGARMYGTGPNVMVLLVAGDALLDGVIDVGGLPAYLGAAAGPGASAGGAAEDPGLGVGGGGPGRGLGWIGGDASGGGGAGFGGRGGAGGDVGMYPGGGGGNAWATPELVPLVGGSGGGGGGGDADGGHGGAGAGAFQLSAGGRIVVADGGGITAGGRGGQGGQEGGGGGGGGSGGAVLLEAREIAVHGGVACNGGGGGAGARSGSSAGEDGQPGELRAAPAAPGGLGRDDGTSGGAGSDALAVDGADGVDAEPLSLDDAGGAGGGAGRIRLNGPAIDVEGFLSPAESTGLATRGDCATR